MDMFPKNYDKKNVTSLQSRLFGHRLRPGQTKYEYLIEFFQVALAPKRIVSQSDVTYEQMFPVINAGIEDIIEFSPRPGMCLKRFIFMPNSKLDGKAKVDQDAYEECIRVLEDSIVGGTDISKKEAVKIIQNLLCGFNAINQNRSWFDQNMLPICPEVILPEGMGLKSKRKGMNFERGKNEVDCEFAFDRYTYMCRGGEIYYLHLLDAINQHPEKGTLLEKRFQELVNSFPQFSFICKYIRESWESYIMVTEDRIEKKLGAIPVSFEQRNEYTLSELANLLNSKSHPFDKMEILSNGIILQLLRMMYIAASTETESNCWLVDVNCKEYENTEVKKAAIGAFNHNEEVFCKYLYRGLENFRRELSVSNDLDTIKKAADDSYRLFRKLGKAIGLVIPVSGPGMRFSLSEDVIKFLVLSLIPPRNMITLDEFIELLYDHFGMVIAPEQYRIEMKRGSLKEIRDLSFLEENKTALAQKLKECGFLRDLSDATAIVENPYEGEVEI